MKKLITIITIVAIFNVQGMAKIDLVTIPDVNDTKLTIYNSADLTLARQNRNLTLKQGTNRLEFSWANTLIDPTSLELTPQAPADQIGITSMSFPPDVRNSAIWNIKSQRDITVPVQISYLTSGLTWQAFYNATLNSDETNMDLDAYVRVTNNSGEDYQNANVRLIVGKIHTVDSIAELAQRDYPYGRPGQVVVPQAGRRDTLTKELKYQMQGALAKAQARPKEIKKEGISEYFLYSIEGTETIPDGWSKRLKSFTANNIPVTNLYKYEQKRYSKNVIRFLSFKNSKQNNLGQTPIPGGEIRAYRTLYSNDRLSYTGKSSFKYIPVGQEVELNLGPVTDVMVEPVKMDYQTSNYRFDKNGDINGWDETEKYEVTVKNTRDIPVRVQYRKNFPTAYWSLKKSGDFESYQKVDSDTVEFEIKIDSSQKKVFQYTVTTYNGVRQEDYAKSSR